MAICSDIYFEVDKEEEVLMEFAGDRIVVLASKLSIFTFIKSY